MFLGTTSDHDHAYWKGLIDQGISDHVRALDKKHPGWETWSRRFVGNHEDGYFTSDWHKILKFRAPLLVVGMATEPCGNAARVWVS